MNQPRLEFSLSAEASLLASSVERDIDIYILRLWVLRVGGRDRDSAGTPKLVNFSFTSSNFVVLGMALR
jgi:hypothetical protein